MRAGGDPTVMGDVVNTAQRLEKLGGARRGDRRPGHLRRDPRRDPLRGARPAGPARPRRAGRGVPRGRRAHAARPAPRARTARRSSAATPSSRRSQHVVSDGGDRAARAPRACSRRRGRRQEPARERARDVRGDASIGADRARPGSASRTATPTCSVRSPRRCADACGARRHRRDAIRRATRWSSQRVAIALGIDRRTRPSSSASSKACSTSSRASTRPGVDPTRARDDALRSALAFLEALAPQRPLVLTLSDLHWATDDTLELCDRLLARLHNRPFVLVATTRPGLETRWTPEPGKHNGSRSSSIRSTSDATAELVRALLYGDADDETVAFLLERSGGNPFFVEELVAFVQESRDSDRSPRAPGDAARSGRGPARRARSRRALAARRLRGRRRQRVRSRRCSRSRPAPTRAGCSTASPNATSSRSTTTSSTSSRSSSTRSRTARSRRPSAPAATPWSRPCSRRAANRPIDQAAHHLATAAELVAELGAVAGVPADVREQAIAALQRAAERAESVESWLLAERHHDRALGAARHREHRRPAHARCSAGPGRACNAASSTTRATTCSPCSPRRARPATASSEAVALTLLGEGEAAAGAYDVAEETFGDALDAVARARRRVGRAERAARARHDAPLPRRPRAGRAVRVRGARLVPLGRATSAARRGRCRTSRGSRSRTATSRAPRSGSRSRPTCSASSATGAASAGRTACSRSSATTRAGSTKPPRSPSTSRSTAARPATAGPSA